MLDIFICEDNLQQRKELEEIIEKTILIEDLSNSIKISSANPRDILNYLEVNEKTNGLYFLDVDLKNRMDGIDLAKMIREYDDLGKIVFITTHSELSYLTFKYKIEALDYIIKDSDNVQQRVKECILLANSRHVVESDLVLEKYSIKINDTYRLFDYGDIMFFEASSTPHKVILHLDNGQVGFYGNIKDVKIENECLYRCHRSYVVNRNNIESINKNTREIIMKNGEICLVSIRGLSGLL